MAGTEIDRLGCALARYRLYNVAMNEGNSPVKKGFDQGWAALIAAIITGLMSLFGVWYQQQSQKREAPAASTTLATSPEANPSAGAQPTQNEGTAAQQNPLQPPTAQQSGYEMPRADARQENTGPEPQRPQDGMRPQVYTPHGSYQSIYSGGSRIFVGGTRSGQIPPSGARQLSPPLAS